MYHSYSTSSFGPRSHTRYYLEPEKIYPSTPLGRPRQHIRYIRPAPPTYVTEYEDKFEWYPPEFYALQLRKREPISIPFATDADGEGNQWDELLSTVHRLINKNYEENLMKLVLHQVEARSLDAGVEFMYRHCQDLLRSTEAETSADEGGYTADGANGAGPARACVCHLPADIRILCKEFVDAVDALKRT
jgi:hypothetical protein